MYPIYLDYNATTPVAPEVIEAMLPFLGERFGNASSTHAFGVATRDALEQSRRAVAHVLHADPAAIVFTSGGTESNNLAIEGVVRANRQRGNHIITSAIEHPSVSEVFQCLKKQGMRVSVLPVDGYGRVRAADLEREIRSDTLLVSVMHANNEVGTIQPIAELAAICHRQGVLMHTDAAQSVGKIPVDVDALGVDLLTVAGHKFYAPKGVGALFVRQNVRLAPVLHGAAHERGIRPGTEAVHQIVALGEAARLATRDLSAQSERCRSLRDQLEDRLLLELGEDAVRINGQREQRLPNTSSVSFRGVVADALLASIAPRVAASAGSACHAHDVRLSPVLTAMGIELDWGMGTLRLSVGRPTTESDMHEAAIVIAQAVRNLTINPAAAV
jgi:cysteine desulfurase